MKNQSQMKNQSTDKLKILLLFLILGVVVIAGFLIIGKVATSSSENEEAVEQQHMYWKDVSCEVEKKEHSLFSLDLYVYNKEYDIRKWFHLYGDKKEQLKDIQEGDNIICQMYSWTSEDTGEIVDRVLYDIVL